MRSVRSVLRAFDGAFLDPEPSAPLALFRLLFGACSIIVVLAFFQDFHFWSGPDAVVSPESNRLYLGFQGFSIFRLLRPNDLTWRLFLLSLIVASMLLMLSAWKEKLFGISTSAPGRVAMVWLYLGLLSCTTEWPMVLNSADTLLRISAFLLIFSPSVSLSSNVSCQAWVKRLIQLQICVVYLATALWKIQGAKWADGTAAFWSIQFPSLQRFPELFLFHLPVWMQALLARGLTWGTLAVEFSFPFLVWFRETRRPILLLTLMLHLGIAMVMRLAYFELLMICHLALFLKAEEVHALVASGRRPKPARA